MRIGMNVLDQFKMLIDLHQPKVWPANPKGVWGLQRTPVATGKLKPGKVREVAPAGSWVTVQYTDETGGLLLDGNGNPISARQQVPASGKVDFDAPAGTQDFIQWILIPAGGALDSGDSQPNEIACDGVHWLCNSLMVEALIQGPLDMLVAAK